MITPESKLKVSESVHEAELKTSAEILPMVVKSSASAEILLVKKSMNHLRDAYIASGAIMLVLLALNFSATLLVAGLVFSSVAFLAFVKLNLILRSLQGPAVMQRALQEFKDSGITDTLGSTGVLLFVSLEEKQVIVLADTAIHRQLNNHTWEKVVEKTVEGIKQDSLEKGLIAGIQELGTVLHQVCPRLAEDRNEISNDLVVKD